MCDFGERSRMRAVCLAVPRRHTNRVVWCAQQTMWTVFEQRSRWERPGEARSGPATP